MGRSAVIVMVAAFLGVSCGGLEPAKVARSGRGPSTLGAPPPAGAVVLLPFGKGAPGLDEWDNDSWPTFPDGSMQVGKGDIRTRRQFGDIRLHVEFRTPDQPGAERDRGNSGVYLQDRYEVQILETFGIAPDLGVCGAIYQVAAPRVNAALRMLEWQTYDITFRAPELKPDGAVARSASLSVIHNGIPIHDGVEVLNQTGGGPAGAVEAGPVRLQDHGHPVRFRNIWVVELDEKP